MTKNLVVKCVDNSQVENLLTIGKTYQAKIENAEYEWKELNFLDLIDDSGKQTAYLQYRFDILETR